MASFFPQNNPSQRNIHEQKYRSARMFLLIVILSTVVNLALLTVSEDSYMLFSAFIPYFLTTIGMVQCGLLPPEYYEYPMEDYIFYDKSLFVALLIISIILTSLYLLAWFMSKKNRVGWLIFALVFFAFGLPQN
mgnify:CR=1 FL=1